MIVGSSLPWTYYWPGGDTTPLNLSGLSFPYEWGVWTLMIGAGMIFGALLAMGVSPYRYLLVAVPATVGLALRWCRVFDGFHWTSAYRSAEALMWASRWSRGRVHSLS